MRFLKVLGALLLFISGSGNSSFASIDFTSVGIEEQEAVLMEFEEGSSFRNESMLPGLSGFQNFPVFYQEDFDFRLHSLYESRLTENYINFSRSIIPGLEISDIIYPFHSFL